MMIEYWQVTSKSVNEDDGRVTLKIVVTPALTGSDIVVVSYETADVTATSSADYTAISSTDVTLDAANSSHDVIIDITDDGKR